jgi:hypothetical protein
MNQADIVKKIFFLIILLFGPFVFIGLIYSYFRDLNNGVIAATDKKPIFEGIVVLVLLVMGYTWTYSRSKNEYGWFTKK